MNTFIYHDTLGSEWDTYSITYPIRTTKSKSELVNLLQAEAIAYVEQHCEDKANLQIFFTNLNEDFIPWGQSDPHRNYEIDLQSCYDRSIERKLISYEDWKGVIL